MNNNFNNMESKIIEAMQAELEELRHQLFEAKETIDAIRTGQIDALVLESGNGHELYTLKTADLTYRVFIEKMTEGAITLNKEGIILYCNSQFASLVQQPLSNVIGSAFNKFIEIEDEEIFNNVFKISWTTDSKTEVKLKGNTLKIPVQLSLTPLELEDGIALSIIITDLTSQKKTQQQLEDNNKELAMMNHDLQQFASVASHDLQEPLRKITIFSNLLKENSTNLSADSKKYLDKIVESTGRMKTLIIDVLNHSKLSAKDIDFNFINLNNVLEELLEDFELIINEKKAQIIINKLPELEVNRGQIRQVFQNIISNALKFSKENEAPVIIINAKRINEKSFDADEQHDGPFCIISIKDNGIGFDEKYLPKIFALFERLNPKNIYEGTGIGLAITKKIIEKHNGLIHAKSQQGYGTEFLLLLPVSQ